MKRKDKSKVWPWDVLKASADSIRRRIAVLGLKHPADSELLAFLRGRLATLVEVGHSKAKVDVRRACGVALALVSADVWAVEERYVGGKERG